MSESSLSLTRSQIQRHVARFLGWDRGGSWTSNETTDINDAIDAGCRQFYVPPVLPRERVGHRWSFLRPTLSIATVANTSDYPLPDLFGGFVGSLAYASADNVPYRHLKMTGLAEILAKRAALATSATAAPEWFATYPNSAGAHDLDGTVTGQRFSIAFYPTPPQVYTLTGEYFINPYQLAGSATYPLGGQPHAQTLLASCIAAADLQMNQTQGQPMEKFMELLAASVSFDRGTTGTMHFGYNRDRSGNHRFERQPTQTGFTKYNGVDYSH